MGGTEVIPRGGGPGAGVWRRALVTGAAGAALGLLVASGAFVCPTAFFFRVPCPGCGLTRAARCLLRADLRGALAFHPLAPLLVPSLAAFCATNAWVYVRTGRFGYVEANTGRAVTAAAAGLLIASLVVWVARFFGAFGGPVAV